MNENVLLPPGHPIVIGPTKVSTKKETSYHIIDATGVLLCHCYSPEMAELISKSLESAGTVVVQHTIDPSVLTQMNWNYFHHRDYADNMFPFEDDYRDLTNFAKGYNAAIDDLHKLIAGAPPNV